MFIAISLHILAATIWVGGMFFAYSFLRPAAADILEPPQRLTLWVKVFKKFFNWVWLAIILLIVSGHFMIAQLGGLANVGKHIHIMMLLGYIMTAIFMHVYFAPFKRLKAAVGLEDWSKAASNLNVIRKMILLNLALGLLTVFVASAGRYIML
ncbi:CopD family protein [Paraglaciecola arctica]|uniref:Conserved hypothetical membrane spanning protein n=1 Tax=Paraglaciecola arctica BSs20135 TaxID=493475 RepID=K6XC94_9ALTE|nr:CopD family protein [Paraglaciecola arctica]GAC18259.1 conserved hypothetical membrane spanning protein [Paraglaciecola arctica BSs20135]